MRRGVGEAGRGCRSDSAEQLEALEGAIHPLDLPVGPRMIWLRHPMLDPVRSTEQIEHMGSPPGRRPLTVLRQVAELNAVIGGAIVDRVRDNRDQVLQECGRGVQVRLLMELRERKLRSSMRNATNRWSLPSAGKRFGDVDVEVADWVALERLLLLCLAFDRRQPADGVALEQAMQR